MVAEQHGNLVSILEVSHWLLLELVVRIELRSNFDPAPNLGSLPKALKPLQTSLFKGLRQVRALQVAQTQGPGTGAGGTKPSANSACNPGCCSRGAVEEPRLRV